MLAIDQHRGPECDQGKKALFSATSRSKKGDCLMGFSIGVEFRAADGQKDKLRKLCGLLQRHGSQEVPAFELNG